MRDLLADRDDDAPQDTALLARHFEIYANAPQGVREGFRQVPGEVLDAWGGGCLADVNCLERAVDAAHSDGISVARGESGVEEQEELST